MRKLLISIFWLFLVPVSWSAWDVRYVSVAGGGAHDGSSEANAWTLAEAVANCNAGDQINVIADTYTLAGDFDLDTPGTDLAPIWWRGYNSVIGDMDAAGGTRTPGTTIPLIDADDATDQVKLDEAFQIFSNFHFASVCTDAGGAVNITGGDIRLLRCRVINSAANAAAGAITAATAGSVEIVACQLQATTTATNCVNFNTFTNGNGLIGCWVKGGVTAVRISAHTNLSDCVIESFATTGISDGGNGGYSIQISHCTIYAAATDAYKLGVTPTSGLRTISNNIIGGCTNGINNNSGANTNQLSIFANHFYGCTNNLVNVTENADVTSDLGAALLNIDDDTDPFTAKGASDFTLNTDAAGRSAGFPGIPEGQTTMVGYSDMGALRHQDPSGGAGNFISRLVTPTGIFLIPPSLASELAKYGHLMEIK